MSRRQLITIAAVVVIAAAAVLTWNYLDQRWPAGDLDAHLKLTTDLVLDEPATIVLYTGQDFARTQRLGISATLQGIPMDIKSVEFGEYQKEDNKRGALVKFTVIPRAAVCKQMLQAFFKRQGKVVDRTSVDVTVPMPYFYRNEEQSFLELVGSPDSSIYGSQITTWNPFDGKAELFTVTGHAATSVCRVASAALFELARQTDTHSAYFALGAGFACIDVTGLEKEIEASKRQLFHDYPEMAAELQSEVTEGQEQTEEISEELKKLPPEYAELFADRLKLPDVGDSKAIIEKMALPWLQRLSDAITLDLNPDRQADPAILQPLADALRSLSVKVNQQEEKPSKQEIEVLRRLLAEPMLGVEALGQQRASEMSGALAVRKGWDVVKRETFDAALRGFTEKAGALETAKKSFADLETRTGLVRSAESTVQTRADVDRITERVAAWAAGKGAPRTVELSAIAAGHEGCLLLPFFDAQGKPIEFTLDERLLASAEGQDWRRIVQSSTAVDLVATAKEIQSRAEKQIAPLDRQLLTCAQEGELASKESDLTRWLAEKNERTVENYDAKSRYTGSHKESWSNLRSLVNAWHSAFAARYTARSYGQIVEAAERSEKDQRFEEISDSCLLDSLLRGWNLAIADEEAEKKYESWSKQTRDAVWSDLWLQALAKGVDLRALRTEGTVFQIFHEKGQFSVRPRFVADIDQTYCVRSKDGGTIGYTSTWFLRQRVDYQADKNTPSAKTPEAFGQELLEKVQAAAHSQVAAIQQAPADRQADMLDEAVPKFLESVDQDFSTALCAAPERTVSAAIQKILAPWPEPKSEPPLSRQERDECAWLSRYNSMEEHPEEDRDWFEQAIEHGSWPFADEYLWYAQACREKAKSETPNERAQLEKYAAKLTDLGKRTDAEFVAAVVKDPSAASRPSDRRRRSVERLRGLDDEQVINALRILTLLREAECSFESWDDEGQNRFQIEQLASDLQSAPAGLRDALQSPLEMLAKLIANGDFEPKTVGVSLTTVEGVFLSHAKDLDRNADLLLWRTTDLMGRLARSSGRTPEPSTKRRVVAALSECEQLMGTVSANNWLDTIVKPKHELLKALIARIDGDPDYDPVDRRKYRLEVADIEDAIGEVTVEKVGEMHHKAPSRWTIETLVQTKWSMGQYTDAIGTLCDEATKKIEESLSESGNVRTEPDAQCRSMEAVLYIELFRRNETELLKACVYSGGEFFGASIFGRRPNDWVQKPKTIEQVVVRLDTSMQPDAADASLRFTPDLTNGEASEFSQLYREAMADPQFALAAPRTIGGYTVIEAVPASFTDVRVFKVVDLSGARSIIKILPNDKEGNNYRQLAATVRMTDYAARCGAEVPVMLPVRRGGGGRGGGGRGGERVTAGFPDGGGEFWNPLPGANKVLETPEVVIIRETEATGQELGQLVEKQGGVFTAEQERQYIDTTLDLFVRGKNLPNGYAAKEPVRTFSAMRDKLLERAEESREHFDLFAQTKLYRETLGAAKLEKGLAFHESFERYIEQLWAGDKSLEEYGWVHDAITRNYIIDDGKITIIDVGSDYVGSVGHSIATIATQLQPRGKTWTFSEFKEKVSSLMDRYAARVGKLNEQQEIEIIQHLPVQPYRMLSCDSDQLVRQVRIACGVPDSATEGEFLTAMRRPENIAKIEAYLVDEQTKEKFDRHMTLVEYSLRMLDERLPATRVDDKQRLSDLIQRTREAREAGVRVVLLTGGIERTLSAAP
jgi:hypothetical protein